MDYLERLWDTGQRHLAAGRYVAARRELETAEGLAWRRRDAASLARLYLPLLEVRRQIRLSSVEGVLVISAARAPGEIRRDSAALLRAAAGTQICAPRGRSCRMAGELALASRRTGRCFEALVLLEHHGVHRLASPADPTFAGGIDVITPSDPAAELDPDAIASGRSPLLLPPPGVYDPMRAEHRAWHALARESLLLGWPALAGKWQQRHPLNAHGLDAAWYELAWLRLALRMDPANEPAAMRSIALAERLARG